MATRSGPDYNDHGDQSSISTTDSAHRGLRTSSLRLYLMACRALPGGLATQAGDHQLTPGQPAPAPGSQQRSPAWTATAKFAGDPTGQNGSCGQAELIGSQPAQALSRPCRTARAFGFQLNCARRRLARRHRKASTPAAVTVTKEIVRRITAVSSSASVTVTTTDWSAIRWAGAPT